ncbi:hypothetical protein M433DRAFT_548736 [Acidomyces richmondensis BFW]|nr:hypothetical protein M433DRAFT_548736 [Acidomyces richmondensis BFW]
MDNSEHSLPRLSNEDIWLYNNSFPCPHEIDHYITTHPLTRKLKGTKGAIESRPHLSIPPGIRAMNLTGSTLLGKGKVEVPPVMFQMKNSDLPHLVQIFYLGRNLCGHPGIVHGGLLATIMDEGLARACFPVLPNKIGVTANLKISYENLCPVDSYVVLKAETVKVDGRKAWTKGSIQLLGDDATGGQQLVTGEALFIEPKSANSPKCLYSVTE